jgi:hypothetical protein
LEEALPFGRWCLLAGAGAVVVGLVLAPVPAVAAHFRAACQLAGTAAFLPLAGGSDSYTYGFHGALSGCRSVDAPTPPRGTVEAGRTITVPYYWSYIDELTGAAFSGNAYASYQEPVVAGSGGCANSASSGSALVTWADRTTTILAFRTAGSGAAVSLTGSVSPSLSLALTGYTGPPQAPPAASYVVVSTRFPNEAARGVLFFQPPNPGLCGRAGSASAAIGGEVGLGSAV